MTLYCVAIGTLLSWSSPCGIAVRSRTIGRAMRGVGVQPARPVSLLATTQGGLHFFEGRKIFLESIPMLLHLHDGCPEFRHQAKRPAHAWHLRLSRPRTHGSTHEPEEKHPTQQTDKHPPS